MPHVLVGFADAEAIQAGDAAHFTLIGADGQRFAFALASDVLDALLSNLERLAALAMIERSKLRPQPFRPNDAVPPYVTHCDRFLVEEIDQKHLKMVLRRRGRTDIEVPIGRGVFGQLQSSFWPPPASIGRNN